MQAMAVAAAMEIAKKAGGGLLKKVGTKAQGCNYEVVVDFEISNFTESEMYVIGSSTSDGCMVVQPINVPAKGLMEFTARKTNWSAYGSKGCSIHGMEIKKKEIKLVSSIMVEFF
uniref:Uncharacterized protein n=1 Tax=Acrobeloides nanus TaxID=290746 RepID=A0A914ELD8_9BILA